jgi:hypothetical protein
LEAADSFQFLVGAWEREYTRYHGISGRNPRRKYPFKRQGGVFKITAKACGKRDVAEDSGGGHGG